MDHIRVKNLFHIGMATLGRNADVKSVRAASLVLTQNAAKPTPLTDTWSWVILVESILKRLLYAALGLCNILKYLSYTA
jgi:hypothetical protein